MEIQRGRGLVNHFLPAADEYSDCSALKIGHAPLTGACSAAVGLFLRENSAGQKYLTKLEKKHGSDPALTLWAQKLGRAVYYRLRRHTAFAMGKLLTGEGRGADEPTASRDHHGLRLRVVLCNACIAASVNAQAPIGPVARSLWPLLGHPLRRVRHGVAAWTKNPFGLTPPRWLASPSDTFREGQSSSKLLCS